MATAPYTMTALGIYALQKGKEKENLFLCATGAGLLGVHMGGIIGDWFLAGKRISYEAMDGFCNLIGTETPENGSFTENLIVGGGGMILGIKMLTGSYRFMKGSVNSLRQWYAERRSFPQLPPTV